MKPEDEQRIAEIKAKLANRDKLALRVSYREDIAWLLERLEEAQRRIDDLKLLGSASLLAKALKGRVDAEAENERLTARVQELETALYAPIPGVGRVVQRGERPPLVLE